MSVSMGNQNTEAQKLKPRVSSLKNNDQTFVETWMIIIRSYWGAILDTQVKKHKQYPASAAVEDPTIEKSHLFLSS